MNLLHLRRTTLNKFNKICKYNLGTVAEADVAERPPKTFSNQSQLPRLPIPSLEHTLNLYSRSLAPLFSNSTLEEANKSIHEFVKPDGVGNELQKRLFEYDTKQKNSWLETLWLNKGYLEYREPTLLNVNYWASFSNPPQGLIPSPPKGKVSPFQLERSAGIITGLLNFNDSLNREEFPPGFSKGSPVCMNQFRQQIGTTRIALPVRDQLVSSYPCLAHHIVVSYKNQLIKVPVYGPQGQRAKNAQLVHQLKRATELVDNLEESKLLPPVGILTGEHRDIWAGARERLEKSSVNASTFSAIDHSLFVLCLEDYSTESDCNSLHSTFLHGDGGLNRWFDKAIQVIVKNNGCAGLNGEHTPADAAAPGAIFSEIIASEPVADPLNALDDPSLEEPSLLNWEIDTKVNQVITDATKRIPNSISEIRSTMLQYEGFGRKRIKGSNISPDAFAQMALQLAYYRLHGEVCPTYETCATRGFLHGRTETTRSCSIESKAFVQKFDDRDASKEDKLASLKLAMSSHLAYAKKAARGEGVDRHLLGLRSMIKDGEPTPELFSHPTYLQSMNFKLSTSNSSPGVYMAGGFAPGVSDGYGINYSINPTNLKISTSRWARQGCTTDEQAMKASIVKSLDDLGAILNI